MPTTSNSSSTADCRAVCEDVLKSNKNDFVDAEAMAEAIELVEVIPAQDPKLHHRDDIRSAPVKRKAKSETKRR